MHLTFLGGARTVTGSRFLLETERAKVLIDCGMFQGSPNEVIRNRVPLWFDPAELDSILVTHAHLDHCGYLPVVVREGFSGPIHLTSATGELGGPGRRVDRARVARFDEQRQQAAVVEMGVGQEHCGEVGRLERERDPVSDRFVRAPLEHPAVDEDLRALGDQQEL